MTDSAFLQLSFCKVQTMTGNGTDMFLGLQNTLKKLWLNLVITCFYVSICYYCTYNCKMWQLYEQILMLNFRCRLRLLCCKNLNQLLTIFETVQRLVEFISKNFTKHQFQLQKNIKSIPIKICGLALITQLLIDLHKPTKTQYHQVYLYVLQVEWKT